MEKKPVTTKQMGVVWKRQIGSTGAIINYLLKNHGSSLSDESLFVCLLI